MHFDLSDEQRAIADSLGSVLAAKLSGARIVEALAAPAIDRALWKDLCALELMGMLVPERVGGLEQDLVTLAVVAETLGAHAAPAPVISNSLAAWVIAQAGSNAQRGRWLGPLMRGEIVAAFALGEEDNRWLPHEWTLSGAPLSGRKTNVEWGAEADVFIVGLAGGALALVSAKTGVTRTPIDPLDRSRPLATVDFDAAAADSLPGGAALAPLLTDAMLVLLAADACGAGFTAMNSAVIYAKERSQFGQLIGRFQALKHQLADMAVELEPSRPLVWYAAHAWDVYPERRTRAAAIAKAHVTDGAVLVARAAVEAHGGIGYTWDYPLHIFLKRAMFDRNHMGGPRLHRARMAKLANW